MIAGAQYCPPPALALLGFANSNQLVTMLKMGDITTDVKKAIKAGQVVLGA